MGRKKRRRQEVKVVRATAEGVSRGEEGIQSKKEGGRGGRKHCKRRESNSSLNTYKKPIANSVRREILFNPKMKTL